MEAPEKVYLSQIEKGIHYYTEEIPFEREYIEYTRKDAFIEKACDAYCKVCGHYPHTVPTHICRKNCDYFSDFKKYMKGISYEGEAIKKTKKTFKEINKKKSNKNDNYNTLLSGSTIRR